MLENKIVFGSGFNGYMEAGGQKIVISGPGVHPYDMTFGATASCLYSTFLDYVNANQLDVRGAEIIVTGEKRTEPDPCYLTWVNVDITVDSDADMEDIEKAWDYAWKNCSMLNMVAHVAKCTFDLKKK